ncbi:MAG: prolyl oligopeptidase family serine peptidase [Devosia sp.]|nr:prolyl oligopeptidase family serine peptidase [Devosia sp.]
MIKLSGPMVPPRRGGPPTRAMVLLHGYGSDGNDLIGLASYWRELLPGAMFVAPNAPEPCRDNPAGYQWFPIDFERPDYRFEGAGRAAPVIREFLADLWRQTDLEPEDTILAGFSQGAMMALHVGLSLDAALLGVIGFSGALIAPAGFLDDVGPRPPICLVHGERDQVVDPDLSAQAAAILRGRGFDVRFHVEPGAGHTITEDGLAFASAFIASLAPQAAQG